MVLRGVLRVRALRGRSRLQDGGLCHNRAASASSIGLRSRAFAGRTLASDPFRMLVTRWLRGMYWSGQVVGQVVERREQRRELGPRAEANRLELFAEPVQADAFAGARALRVVLLDVGHVPVALRNLLLRQPHVRLTRRRLVLAGRRMRLEERRVETASDRVIFHEVASLVHEQLRKSCIKQVDIRNNKK